MGTYYIKPNGINQGDLINALKDVETALGGTNSTESIAITTTVLGASAGVSSNLAYSNTAPSYIQSCHTAGTAFMSAVSAAVSAGYAGGTLKLFSAMGSTLKSAGVSGF